VARFGDGLACDADLSRAAERAARQALGPLSGRRPDLACVFVSGADPDAADDAGEVAARVLGARVVVGCSAHGVIGDGRAVEETSAVAVWTAVLPEVNVRSFHLEVIRTPDGMAVVGLPERRADDAVVLLFADPYSFPVDGFVVRSHDALDGLPIVGGIGLGIRGPGSTRLFLDGRVIDRGAVGVLLGGPVAARPLVSQGCRPVGPEMVVTRADGNVIRELAGVAALGKLESVIAALDPSEQALATDGLQLGIAMDEYAEVHERGDFLVRSIGGADGSGLVVGDVVAVGQTVRFQVRDAAAADEDLCELLRKFRAESGFDTVEGALLISCNGRGRQLFSAPDHDVVTVRRELATGGVGGFFAAGEIGPVGGRNYLHGFTASILAFGSGAGADRGTRPR